LDECRGKLNGRRGEVPEAFRLGGAPIGKDTGSGIITGGRLLDSDGELYVTVAGDPSKKDFG
jgi:hypothetical protein